MAPPTRSKHSRPKIRFRTGEYDDGNITQEFQLPKRRSSLAFIGGRETSASILSTDGDSSEDDLLIKKKAKNRRLMKARRKNRNQQGGELDSMTNFLIQFRILSGKSSARDKVMAFAQSFCVFRQGLLGPSTAPHIYLLFRTFEDWMKDTRKGFKLLKWVVEIEKTRSAYTTISDFFIRWLEVTMHIVAMGYHFVDNRIFVNKVIYRVEKLINDDLLVRHGPKPVPGEVSFLDNLKRQKNQFSLVRCVLSIICETRWVLNLTEDIRVHVNEKNLYIKKVEELKNNTIRNKFMFTHEDTNINNNGKKNEEFEIKDNIIDINVVPVNDNNNNEDKEEEEEEDEELIRLDEKEHRLRAIRRFHLLMLIRVCCYFIMTSSKRGHLFGFKIPFIGQTLDGIFGMIGAGIAVWKNLPSVIKG
eukprot:g8690.t1